MTFHNVWQQTEDKRNTMSDYDYTFYIWNLAVSHAMDLMANWQNEFNDADYAGDTTIFRNTEE